MSITIKEFDGYDFNEEMSLMAKKCATKKKEACAPKKATSKAKSTKEACKSKKKK